MCWKGESKGYVMSLNDQGNFNWSFSEQFKQDGSGAYALNSAFCLQPSNGATSSSPTQGLQLNVAHSPVAHS